MDNEAFRALVAERSRTKSTKEIAREAVEQEFRDRKSRAGGGGRKRRRGDGGGSSSDEGGGGGGGAEDSDDEYRRRDDDDDDDDDDQGGAEDGEEEDGRAGDKRSNEPRWKKERRAKRRAKEEAEGKIRYRDRARERREGRSNVDYAGTEALEQAASAIGTGGGADAAAAAAHGDSGAGGLAVLGEVDADMTKFLGGDEAHTHLVKGLDWALAQKVRREEMAGTVEAASSAGGTSRSSPDDDAVDLEQLLRSSSAKRIENEAWRQTITKLSSKSDAAEVGMVLNRLEKDATTVLGKGMASYLKSRSVRVSTSSTGRSRPAAADDDEVTSTTGSGPSSSGIYSSVGGNNSKLGVTNAGRTLQRTKLQFFLRYHPGDVVHSWEVPREEVSSLAEYERSRRRMRLEGQGNVAGGGTFGDKLTPLDDNYVLRIKSALRGSPAQSSATRSTADDSRSKKKKSNSEKKKKKKHTTGKIGRENELRREGDDGGVDSTEAKVAGVAGNADADAGNNGTRHAVSNIEDEKSSDEDIFGGAGEYVPSIPSPTAARKDESSKPSGKQEGERADVISRGKIFSGLNGPEDANAPASAATVAASNKNTGGTKSVSFGASAAVAPTSASGKKRNVIHRDVLGARPPDFHGKPEAAGGVSISGYSGGYGEEMDIDFAGMAESEAVDDDKKKKSSDLTTMAAMEYGRRSGRSAKSDDGGGMV